MALTQYRIPCFFGIHQGSCENMLDSGESPDACNMDTFGGNLSVAKGYVHASETPLPEPNAVRRLYVWNRADGARCVAATDHGLYALGQSAAVWERLYAPAENTGNPTRYDFQVVKIAGTEYLIVADGVSQMVKWDGGSGPALPFGSAEGLSDRPENFIELYYNRLFAAGDPAFPCRLYWSQAPGEARTLENWAAADEGESVSGGHVEVGTDSDPITGLFAFSNQLLIFKRDSLYRLLGDRPDNYRILQVNAAMRQPVHTGCIRYGDVLYFLTDGGMYYYDGQTVQRQPDADKIKAFLRTADLTCCLSAACRDKLYFAVRENASAQANDAVLVYDLARRTYMIRRGFLARDLFSAGGVLYLVDADGYVCRFEEGGSYAGRPIDACWRTPLTDLGAKESNKRLVELYLRGSGGVASIEAASASGTAFYERVMPALDSGVMEVPLTGDGRAFSLRFRNVNGSAFTVDGGVELLIDQQRRAL